MLAEHYADAWDWEKSFQCYVKAAQHGSVRAAFKAGLLAWYGLGCEPDDTAVQRYLGFAAEKGNICAMGNLGAFYIENGLHEQALYWAKKVINYTGKSKDTIAAAVKVIASLENNDDSEEDITRSVAVSFLSLAKLYNTGTNAVTENSLVAEEFYQIAIFLFEDFRNLAECC